MLLCRFHHRQHGVSGLFGKSRINASGVEQTNPQFSENSIQINIFLLQLGNGGICSVGTALGSSYPEAPLCKVKSISAAPSDSIRLCPMDKGRVHTALQNKIFHKVSDFICGKCCNYRSFQRETASKSPHHIVLSAAFPNLELPGGTNPALSRIQAKHNFP